MQTHLSEKIPFIGKATLQIVSHIDELIGKTIQTNEDFFVVSMRENKVHQINIKAKNIVVEDVIRTCGLQLFCKTNEQDAFCLFPEELKRFEEI